jgi:hypothetical protein
MKSLQRVLIILAAAVLVSLITWSVVTVITIASMPTDTMDFTPQMPSIHIDMGLSFLGIFKSLVPIVLIVAVEQAIETWLGRKRNRKNTIATV